MSDPVGIIIVYGVISPIGALGIVIFRETLMNRAIDKTDILFALFIAPLVVMFLLFIFPPAAARFLTLF
jgi:hypothetical protein